jgi:hypothetical protein
MEIPDLIGKARADPRDIVEEFRNGVQSSIALDYDIRGCMARQRIFQKIERLVGYGMRMGVQKTRSSEEIFVH